VPPPLEEVAKEREGHERNDPLRGVRGDKHQIHRPEWARHSHRRHASPGIRALWRDREACGSFRDPSVSRTKLRCRPRITSHRKSIREN